jgi:hypothetical protein
VGRAVVAGRDTALVLEATEGVLDAMPLVGQNHVVLDHDLAVLVRRNAKGDAFCRQYCPETVAAIATIGEQFPREQRGADQLSGTLVVVHLPFGERHDHGRPWPSQTAWNSGRPWSIQCGGEQSLFEHAGGSAVGFEVAAVDHQCVWLPRQASEPCEDIRFTGCARCGPSEADQPKARHRFQSLHFPVRPIRRDIINATNSRIRAPAVRVNADCYPVSASLNPYRTSALPTNRINHVKKTMRFYF